MMGCHLSGVLLSLFMSPSWWRGLRFRPLPVPRPNDSSQAEAEIHLKTWKNLQISGKWMQKNQDGNEFIWIDRLYFVYMFKRCNRKINTSAARQSGCCFPPPLVLITRSWSISTHQQIVVIEWRPDFICSSLRDNQKDCSRLLFYSREWLKHHPD